MGGDALDVEPPAAEPEAEQVPGGEEGTCKTQRELVRRRCEQVDVLPRAAARGAHHAVPTATRLLFNCFCKNVDFDFLTSQARITVFKYMYRYLNTSRGGGMQALLPGSSRTLALDSDTVLPPQTGNVFGTQQLRRE